MKKIRVLHIVGSMNMGGIQVFIMNILRSIDREKFIFDFACMNRENYFENEITDLGGNLFVIESRKNLWKHISKLQKVLRHGNYDCIHIHASHSFSVIDAVIAKVISPKSKIIFHSHTTESVSPGIHKLLQKLIPFTAVEFLACSFEAAQWMYPNSIIRKKRFKLIPNGINTGLYRFDSNKRNEVRKELGISEEKFIVGHVGRLAEPKNHLFLIDVFYTLQKRISDIVLVLVGGDGDKATEIKNKVKSMGIEDKVLFLGIRNDIPALLSVFDVFVFPSLHEGLPVSIIEAQASGLPCIISDTITSEVSISPLVMKLSLAHSPSQWCETIIDCFQDNSTNRLKYFDHIQQSDFEIMNTVRKMSEIYIAK